MKDLSIHREQRPGGEVFARAADNSGEASQEDRWIVAAQANLAAFEPLYIRYRERVYRYLRTRLKSDEDAADLTQQVFLQALAALPRYHPRGVPFAVWLFRIARHAAINQVSRRPEQISWDALPETFLELEHDEPGPELQAMQREALHSLRELLASLEPEKRELLALRFAGGLNATQIAALVGKQPEAVRKQITRLLQSFKEHYRHEHL